jgi:glyoxylate/hydroxypyruvate reductase A
MNVAREGEGSMRPLHGQIALEKAESPDSITHVLVYTPIARDTGVLANALQTAFGARLRVEVASDPAAAARSISRADVLMAWKFPGGLFAQAGRLKWVQKLGTGVEDLAQSHVPPGAVVTNMPQVFGPWVAEYCLAYMLACTKQVRLGLELQARREWIPYDPSTLRGAVVGVAGLGHIGLEVARLAKAFGMTVYGLRRNLGSSMTDVTQYVDCTFGPDGRLDFLRDLQYLVLALPRTPETTGFLDREAFEAIRPGVTIVSVGRGNAIVEPELIAALEEGKIGNAVLDVFAEEPLPGDSPLWHTPGVWITPHIAGPVYVDEMPGEIIQQMERFLAGKSLEHVVDLHRGY